MSALPTDRPHLKHWPRRLPRELAIPSTTLWFNLETSAARFPDKAAYVFLGRPLSYRELHAQSLALAGYLQHVAGVKKGDRVLLFMQNSPQFVDRLLRDPARRRGGGAGQPDEPGRRAPPLRHRRRRAGGDLQRRPRAGGGRAGQRRLPEAQRLQHLLVARLADTLPERHRAGPAPPPAMAAWLRAAIALPESGAAGGARCTRWPTRSPPATRPARTRAGPDDLARAALHLGHHRPAQGLHAHPSHADVQRGRRRDWAQAGAEARVAWRWCRCSTSPAWHGDERRRSTPAPRSC